MCENKYINGISSTGFGLEFSVSKILIEDGWTVINNKYYIDDVQGSAREIDILAYRVALKNGIQVYTVLIISCKKSNDKAWALLSKEINYNDPNIDWNPVTLWSNQKILKFIIENYDWKNKYVNSSKDLYNQLFSPKKHIFAFQELKQKNGKPQNDRAIFNSVVSSMKSQNYEIGSLNQRKKEKSLYNFNLISVVDAPLLRMNYTDGDPSVRQISSDIYVGSYIINRQETLSRVHFINFDAFNSSLSIYNKLHSHNINQTSEIFESYYKDCLKDQKKVKLFLKDFSRKIRWDIYETIKGLRDDKSIKDVIGIHWDEKKDCAAITIDDVWKEDEVKALNESIKIIAGVKSTFKKIYRYDGDFYFDDCIPF